MTDTPLAWDVEVRRRTFIRPTPLGPDWTAVTDRFRSLPDLPTPVIITIGSLTLWTLLASIDAQETPVARQVQLRLTEQKSGTWVLLQAISPGVGHYAHRQRDAQFGRRADVDLGGAA